MNEMGKVEILHFSILLSHLIPVPSTWVCQLFMIDIYSWCNLYPALTYCLGPIWLQESQILVSALIHFQLWVFYIILVDQIAGLLVLSSLTWSCGIELATQKKLSQERASLTIFVSKVMRLTVLWNSMR